MTIDERSLDEAIAHAREVSEIQRNNDKLNKTLGKSSPYYNTDCIKCAEESEQFVVWNYPRIVDDRAENDCHKEVIAWQPLPEPFKECD